MAEPTMEDVARVAGVSIATVSRVLGYGERAPVSAERRKQVMAAAVEVGYVRPRREPATEPPPGYLAAAEVRWRMVVARRLTAMAESRRRYLATAGERSEGIQPRQWQGIEIEIRTLESIATMIAKGLC